MKETISVIKKWNDKDDAKYKYLEENFMKQIDCKLYTIHLEDMFQINKSKAI